VKEIARLLNIGTDAIALIDDDPFERDEVADGVKDVLCIDAIALPSLLQMSEFHPRFITTDSKRRRSMYQAEVERREAETVMPTNEFLVSLNMVMTISEANEEDLQRLEELTVRTHQLNSTGHVYSYDELNEFRRSDRHMLLVAGLDDSYGTYGKIGMALVEFAQESWLLKLILMSCRVMSRGAGQILLSHVLRLAKDQGRFVEAEFLRTERNRMMYMTFKLAGFREVCRNGDLATLRHDVREITPYPEHVEVRLVPHSSDSMSR
jgi:FkbH-like protein